MTCYIICSGPRTGSHFLSDLLTSTGVAGKPADYFNPLGAGAVSRLNEPGAIRYNRAYVDALVARTATPNGIFGSMIQFNQAANFVGLSRLLSIFPSAPKIIFLMRSDEIRQAVSLAIARQTGQFLASQPIERAPVYNADQIRCCLEDVWNHNRGWETYFWEHRISPHRISYEECVAAPLEIVRSTLAFIGGPALLPCSAAVGSSIQRQGNELNDRWTRRYRQGSRSDS